MTTPMRAIIIPSDTFCAVDGVGFNGVTMVSVAPEIHAVQWYGTNGEIEIQDIVTGKMISNIQILHFLCSKIFLEENPKGTLFRQIFYHCFQI